MGAAYDLQCDNEQLEKKIKNLQRKVREKDKLLLEFALHIQSQAIAVEGHPIIPKIKKILNKQK